MKNIAVNTTQKDTYVIELAYVCIDDSEKTKDGDHRIPPLFGRDPGTW